MKNVTVNILTDSIPRTLSILALNSCRFFCKGCSELVHWDDPKDGMGREVGGRVKIRNTCTPMADSCECMAKPTTMLYSN